MVAILFIASQSPFDYKNPRLDFVAFTEKSKKQFVRLQVKVYTRDPRSIFPCIDGFTDNQAVPCDVYL